MTAPRDYEIHLDGKPVTKLQAARAAANLSGGYDYPGIRVGVPGEDGWISRDYVDVYARHRAYGEMQPAHIGCASFNSDAVEEMRLHAQMITLAAEIAELAEMLAAEQDAAESAEREIETVPLAWIMADDQSHWRAELPDGRTAVIRRVLGQDGESSLLFVPAVYESALDFVAGPECGVLAAAQWVAEHARVTR